MSAFVSGDSGADGIATSSSSVTMTVYLFNPSTTQTINGVADILGEAGIELDSTAPGSVQVSAAGGFSVFSPGLVSESGSVAAYWGPDMQGSAGAMVPITFEYALNPLETRLILMTTSATGYAEAVPEPATLAVLGVGALALMRRRRS